MNEIEHLKKLAGVNEFNGYQPYTIEDTSAIATANKQIERDNNIKPGDDEWFKLWFSSSSNNGANPLGFRGRTKK